MPNFLLLLGEFNSLVVNMGKRFIFQQSLIIVLLGVSATSFAASNDEDKESWYQIEILIFENVNALNSTSEVWPNNPGMPNFDNAIELAPVASTSDGDNGITDTNKPLSPDNVSAKPVDSSQTAITTENTAATKASLPVPYRLLSSDDFNLMKQEIKLTSSEQYYPLLHVAWRQPVLSDDEARAVHIYSNMEQTEVDNIQSSQDTLEIPPQNGFFSIQDSSSSEPPMNVIDGTVKISMGKYLHLDADILYRIQAEEKNEFSLFGFSREDETPNVFRMHESRRMRSGELHYFDHPLFGMLVLITPYQLPDQPSENIEAVPPDETVPADDQEPEDDLESTPQ